MGSPLLTAPLSHAFPPVLHPPTEVMGEDSS